MALKTVRIEAAELKEGDTLQHMGSACKIATLDVCRHFRWDYPDTIELQLEHPSRGRIAAHFLSDDQVEVLRVQPVSAELTSWLSSLNGRPRKRKVKLVAPQNHLNGWLLSLQETGRKTDTQDRKPTVKRKR